MINTLAIANYRSILDMVVPLGRLNVITGPNGSGKSNLYRALRLLSETANESVVSALAREGGLHSTVWAGPAEISSRMRKREVAVEGTVRNDVLRLKLGFAADDFSYAVSLGLPEPSRSQFKLDPEIKHEAIWAGPQLRPSTLMIERSHSVVTARVGSEREVALQDIAPFSSIFDVLADIKTMPEVFWLRERIRGWRFYDHFRTDRDAPARQPQIGTRTPVPRHDGSDLAAALQTIREIGDTERLDATIAEAFPGARVEIAVSEGGRFAVEFHQHGLLRPLTAAELSDGTLRFLLLAAALLTPRPPSLMVLNEPETSLHPDVLPALAGLIASAAENSQVWVVTHSPKLIAALKKHRLCELIQLQKDLGSTEVQGLAYLERPPWRWPEKKS
ncbi:MAG: AAA family ATPase [Pyrinomonadaceae bacterium]|nr:AAA family ATPase [Pyrinomonadaceae bacterium]